MSAISTDYNLYNSQVSKTNSDSSDGSSKSLDVNDFMNLLVTQLKNQDIMNPSGDTEFIAQMAQFTSLQATQSMTNTMNTQYATTMIGKTVTISGTDAIGRSEVIKGAVSAVNISSGQCKIVVDGMTYDLSSVSKIEG